MLFKPAEKKTFGTKPASPAMSNLEASSARTPARKTE